MAFARRPGEPSDLFMGKRSCLIFVRIYRVPWDIVKMTVVIFDKDKAAPYLDGAHSASGHKRLHFNVAISLYLKFRLKVAFHHSHRHLPGESLVQRSSGEEIEV